MASDGRMKANFDDNSILLLNSTGTAFIHLAPTGSEIHQLSQYALTKYSGLGS